MKHARFALVVLIVFCASAIAQTANTCEGKWLAKVKAPNGHVIDADVEVKGDGGTFQYILMNRVRSPDACFTMEAPITVSKATADEFEFVIKRSVLAGCKDTMARLRRVDDKTFEGKVGTQDATLIRK